MLTDCLTEATAKSQPSSPTPNRPGSIQDPTDRRLATPTVLGTSALTDHLIDPAPQPQPGGYGYGYSDFYPPYPANPTSNTSTPTRTRTKETVVLQPGFAWNRESLALLCKWKEVSKKGFGEMFRSNKFPGKSEDELKQAFMANRNVARQHYRSLYGKEVPGSSHRSRG
jgi:hypothetical protein